MNIFWVLRFCEYFFFFFFWGGGGGGHHSIGIHLGAISMHFRVFFKVNVQNGEYFFSCLNLVFNFFCWGLGVLEIPDIYIYIFFFLGGGGGER